ncbi:uncharacterized protein LOC135077222 isoform X2 [Ostrinia nubilalis]|uniref:uncharacterized protein LOC135077222 isoform X2 n=1 Tax=Ostrinia nubilalis TaxID=29057 RepID=UPI00308246ED
MITTEQYESDDILSVKELKSTVRQSVKNIIDKERFTEYIANIKNQTTNGGNYLGTLQTVAITGKTDGGENKELRLFLKNIMHIEDQFAIVDTLEAYQREGFFYREVFNYFEKIEVKYNIPVEERLNTVKGYSETNDEDGEAVKVIPVDYQIACFGCPVNDFLYFIFLGTDQEFRKNHMQDLKDLYYCTFKNFLGKFGIDANEMYTKKQFEHDFRENLEYGLISFMSVMPFIFTIPGDIPDLGNGIENIALNLDERYKDRLHGVIDDFIQWGYL